MNFSIIIPSNCVRLFLRLTALFSRESLLVVYKGYDDDWEYYIGLYWDEDKNLDVEWYEDYQLWISI